MRTMYILMAGRYDMYGRNCNDEEMGKYNTIEEARETAKATITETAWYSGDWKIIAKTMDEETFTITEKVVEKYDWVDAHRADELKADIHYYEAQIRGLEKSKARCKTESGIIKKDKEIAKYMQWIEARKETLAKWYPDKVEG